MDENRLLREVENGLRSSPNSGALFEKVVMELLHDLGAVEVRRQLSGAQHGFDIWARMPNGEGAVEIWKVECKNLRRPISLDDVAPKLIWHTSGAGVDRFVIAGTSQLTNDLVHFLESHPYSFPIGVWTGELVFRLIASSDRALALLGIGQAACQFSASESVYLPSGPMVFETVHAQNPPRQFAYFRMVEGAAIKAYTSLEFKLNVMIGNRSHDDAVVTSLNCQTLRYWSLKHQRVIVQTKAKGIFKPEQIIYRPSVFSSGETDMLEGKLLSVSGRKFETLCVELDKETTPGYYELQFVARISSVQGSQRLASLIYPLFVAGGGEDSVSLKVLGRHYDDPVERILDLGDSEWRTISGLQANDLWIWLGPLPDEIVRGAAPLEHWTLRGQKVESTQGSVAIAHSTEVRSLIVLSGGVNEPLYSANDAQVRVAGSWEPANWLGDQLNRKRRLVTRGTD